MALPLGHNVCTLLDAFAVAYSKGADVRTILTLTALAGTLFVGAADKGEQAPSAGSVERGAYLVHHVAMCVQCHTPRNEQGSLQLERQFKGASVPVRSPYANQPWAYFAPDIAELPGWGESDIMTLLQSGQRPSGLAPRPPMPSFRMSREDAAAVVAYLKSLE